ncbi:MAG: cupin domain-containing protein [Thermodesulfovibrionales bacterium]|nr:cupin domain-containing protein [Thermodesulfovibrionales bacterium]
MTKKKAPISCDWRIGAVLKGKKPLKENKSALYKHKGQFRWQGIKIEKYKQSGGGWADIVRQTLIGNQGETAKFHVRYYEIAPKGLSSFETHRHEHVVICVRGKGKAIAGKKSHILNFLDTLYISPNTPHQLRNPFKSPFGFFCIVNAKRDKPKILTL